MTGNDARGWVSPVHQYLADNDPEFREAYDAFNGRLLHQGRVDSDAELDLKHRHLIVAILMAYRGLDRVKIARHLRKVLEYGGTERLIVEAFEVAMIPGGSPTLHIGIEGLLEALHGVDPHGSAGAGS